MCALLMCTHIPACEPNNAGHLGALLAHQNNLSSRISQQLMNIRWERIIPRKRRPPPAEAGEAVRSAVKRCPLRINLLKDSLALVRRMLCDCGWIFVALGEREEVCPCGEEERGMMEGEGSIDLHKPHAGFFSQWMPLHHEDEVRRNSIPKLLLRRISLLNVF